MKMKAVKAWALVYRSCNDIRGLDTGIHVIFKRRVAAKEVLDETTKSYGPICRIARVQISELTPKPRKKR